MEIGNVARIPGGHRAGDFKAEASGDFASFLSRVISSSKENKIADKISPEDLKDLEGLEILDDEDPENLEVDILNRVFLLNPFKTMTEAKTQVTGNENMANENIVKDIGLAILNDPTIDKGEIDSPEFREGSLALGELSSTMDINKEDMDLVISDFDKDLVVDMEIGHDNTSLQENQTPDQEDLGKTFISTGSRDSPKGESLELFNPGFSESKDPDIKREGIGPGDILVDYGGGRLENPADYQPDRTWTGKLGQENIRNIVGSLVESMEITNLEGSNLMEVQLYPQELGSVNIELKLEEGKLLAKILVDNDGIKSLFVNSLGELNTNLRHHDVNIENLEIGVNESIQNGLESNLNAGSNSNSNSNWGNGPQDNPQRFFSQGGSFSGQAIGMGEIIPGAVNPNRGLSILA